MKYAIHRITVLKEQNNQFYIAWFVWSWFFFTTMFSTFNSYLCMNAYNLETEGKSAVANQQTMSTKYFILRLEYSYAHNLTPQFLFQDICFSVWRGHDFWLADCKSVYQRSPTIIDYSIFKLIINFYCHGPNEQHELLQHCYGWTYPCHILSLWLD